jgi:DNA replication protein DnaC
VGKKFAEVTFESYEPRNATQLAALETIKTDSSGSYYIYGDYGAGKTHLLVAQYRHFALRCSIARYVRAVELKNQMIAEVTGEGASEGGFSLVAEVRSHEARRLFLDDLDKLKFSDFLREQFFALFDALDQEDAAVSVTSNVPLEELETLIGGYEGRAIGARIERLCRFVELRL